MLALWLAAGAVYAVCFATDGSTDGSIVWLVVDVVAIYALLALASLPRWLKALPLLLVPIVAQVLVATDAERMVAYAFIVYIPLGLLFLTDVVRATPRWGLAAVIATGVLIVCQFYLLPLGGVLNRHGLHFVRPMLRHHAEVRRVLEVCELALVAAVVWIRATLAP